MTLFYGNAPAEELRWQQQQQQQQQLMDVGSLQSSTN
jgi:hypothetical protein